MVPETFRHPAYCRWALMAAASANAFSDMRGLGGTDSTGGEVRRIHRWRFRDLFSGVTHQATDCRTPASLSLPLSSSSCFSLFTSTVYCLVSISRFYFFCVYGDIVFPSIQAPMTASRRCAFVQHAMAIFTRPSFQRSWIAYCWGIQPPP